MRRTMVGQVTRAKAAKTLRVEVSRLVKHPQYGKYIRERTVCHVHDERGEAHEGDTVEIAECRPRSRLKRWELVRVVERAVGLEQEHAAADETAGEEA